jgi:arylsulfatase A
MKMRNQLFSRRAFMGTLAMGTAGLSLSCSSIQRRTASGNKPPNIILIFADDQGYQDLGCFGSPNIKTPNIDRLAHEGMKFTDFYVACSVCSPSRAALMTGCYPQRVGITKVLFPQDDIGISDNEITIPETLKTRGYQTACIGKWHLGHHLQYLPTRHGFDYFFGLPYSNDMHPPNRRRNYDPLPLIRNETVLETNPDQRFLTERYTEEAVAFIKRSKSRPFFLYLPHTMPHVPLHISDRFKGKSEQGLYGDVIQCIDWSVGQIMDTLKKLGLDENTLVFYTSDNGPNRRSGGRALPLRGGKATTYEGGMREPAVARWPGHIPAGLVCSEMALSMDLHPTFAKLAGASMPTDRIIDGKDIWPLMSGQSGAKTLHEAFFYYKGTGLQAVRSGDWKLILPRTYTRRKKTYKVKEALYNLREDIAETTDVATNHPDVVKRLRALAEKCRDDLGDLYQKREGMNRRPCGMLKTK